MATPSKAAVPEFVRPIRVLDIIEREPRRVALVASEDERRMLAARFGLAALERLEAACAIERVGEAVKAEIALSADVIQTCVVSLEPVSAHLVTTESVRFVPSARASEREIDIDVEKDDPPEPIVDGAIELGEIIAEMLGLALDPYPRRAGAAFEGWSDRGGDEAESDRINPFSVLSQLKR
jgi:uncharacterized metal-binding protein YceD (DUF177 family)